VDDAESGIPAPEALALIAADREHVPLGLPLLRHPSIVRSPGAGAAGRRGGRRAARRPERVTLTCQSCGRHASYIERGPTHHGTIPWDPHIVRL